tara:strand:+ start:8922 stop:9092 length:171 start_codon:yes stop_codon:yes gene_type:complete
MCITCKGFRGVFAAGFGGIGFCGFGLFAPAIITLGSLMNHSYRQSPVVTSGRKNVI